MSLTLAQLSDDEATVVVDYMGQTMEVDYRPGALTPAMVEDIVNPTSADDLGTCIEEVVISWDLVDAEANEVSPTAENCINLPMKFLRAVLTAIMEDGSPKPATDARSAGTTRRRGRLKKKDSQTGTGDSKS